MDNKITFFPGMYNLSEDFNPELYLIPEKEINMEQYNMIVEFLGYTGPGRQVIEKGGKYYLKSDEASRDAEARIVKELAELGQVYPVSPAA